MATHGSAQGLPTPIVLTLCQLRWIEGSEGSDRGVYLTPTGHQWYQRTVVDPENTRLLEAWKAEIERRL